MFRDKKEGGRIMKTKEEIKQWLLENCLNEGGYLDLSGLDFSDFDGDIYIGRMIVKKSLRQDEQIVKGNLFQSYQLVGKDLYECCSSANRKFRHRGKYPMLVLWNRLFSPRYKDNVTAQEKQQKDE